MHSQIDSDRKPLDSQSSPKTEFKLVVSKLSHNIPAVKPPKFLFPATTGVLGMLLGLKLAQPLSIPGNDDGASSTAGSSDEVRSVDDTSLDKSTANHRTRTRAQERAADRKPKEPRVSIPVKSLVEGLKKSELSYSSQFDCLEDCMDKTLILLGTTTKEQEEVRNLIQNSKAEILAAEQSHLKLGDVTADVVHMDTSGMRGPVEEIIGKTKSGIRDALPNDLADCLIQSISWDKYYPVDAYTRLEIDRDPSGRLMAWVRNSQRGSGSVVNNHFKDDGTPLPTDQIFPDRWKPLLKGVAILPKDAN